jgi:hypothetical protein
VQSCGSFGFCGLFHSVQREMLTDIPFAHF